MSTDSINKETAIQYLKEFAKELRKETKNIDIDIIIVGGGSIILNYNFRFSTGDFDIIKPNRLIDIKHSANKIADKYNLTSNWINDDFTTTSSYSNKLINYADYYRTFSNHIHFYTIKDEYLIAMKLKSNRNYKNDYSDIIGILVENPSINYNNIQQAIIDLYETLDAIDNDILNFTKSLLEMPNHDLKKAYETILEIEEQNRNEILQELDENLIDEDVMDDELEM